MEIDLMIDVTPYTAAARVAVNGIELVYDSFGDRDAPPILLIAGLGSQMIDWKDEFCFLLAGTGFRVIRFDNRDVGQSTILDTTGHPKIAGMIEARQRGETLLAPYLLWDLVADTVGLLDAFRIEKAHVVGLSMGGMIGQLMAARHRDRVWSFTSIMSHTGEPGLPGPTPKAWECLTAPLEMELERFIAQYVSKWQVYCGPKYPLDVKLAEEHGARLFARGVHTAGRDRQLAAILASGSRKEAIAAVSCPVLVIHGDSDPVVPIAGGLATAAAIRGSRFLAFEGMGHELARPLWPNIVDAISQLARRAQ
jgi:pimeloyl-ACP methyl ester carboxylesterase